MKSSAKLRVHAALLSVAAALAISTASQAQAPAQGAGAIVAAPDAVTIAKIREEGLQRSKVMDTLDYLCNVIGQRLTASANAKRANDWTRSQFSGWGLSNAHIEEWGPFGRGWALQKYSLQVSSPQIIILNGFPKAWSPGFDKPMEMEVVYLDAQNAADLDKYKGKLKDKAVFIGTPRVVAAHFDPQATRQDPQRLERLAAAAAGTEGRGVTTGPASARGPAAAGRGANTFTQRALAFASQEGAALVLDASATGDGGTIFVTQASVPTVRTSTELTGTTAAARAWDAPKAGALRVPAQITLAVEDFNRLVRMIKLGETPKVTADIQVAFQETTTPYNTIAEIPGTDPTLKEQLVMAGAHLDSWHSGTGATDNGTGSAAVMEAARILSTLGLKPKRTIRFALWTGEEQGLLGSRAYVKSHFGYLEDLPAGAAASASQPAVGVAASQPARKLIKGPEFEKFSAYFNIDTGTGKIRGIMAQSNVKGVPYLKEWIAPFNDLGAATVSLSNTGSTDHVSFDTIGLPGFTFLQDTIEYGTRTHHSNEDVYDRVQAEDMRQASTILAAFLWNAANAEERFPRKAFP